MCFQGIYGSFHNFQGDSRVRYKSDAAFGENNNKSSNSQVLTKILNYELIHKNQQQPQDLRHRVVPNSYLTVNAALFLRVHPVLWQY